MGKKEVFAKMVINHFSLKSDKKAMTKKKGFVFLLLFYCFCHWC